MANTERVDTTLFSGDHYLGKPADDEDKIIGRRIAILEKYPDFFNKELTCIEVGCGSGATITRLANRFKESLGIDIYDYAESFNQQIIKNNADNCSFRQIDLEKTLTEQQYDRLISFEVIEHLKNEDSVSSYCKVIKPGGIAAITVPNKWWIFETHGARLPLLPWNRVPFFSWLPRCIHEKYANARIYTAARIKRLMKKHGFTILDQQYVTAPMDVLKDGRLKRMVTKYIFRNDTTSLPFLSTSIFLLIQKDSTDEKH